MVACAQGGISFASVELTSVNVAVSPQGKLFRRSREYRYGQFG